MYTWDLFRRSPDYPTPALWSDGGTRGGTSGPRAPSRIPPNMSAPRPAFVSPLALRPAPSLFPPPPLRPGFSPARLSRSRCAPPTRLLAAASPAPDADQFGHSDLPPLSSLPFFNTYEEAFAALLKDDAEEDENLHSLDDWAGVPVLNVITLTGRLGRDPVLRTIRDGLVVCKFSLAVRDPDDPTTTSWFDVEVWGSLARTVASIARKGALVGVVGRVDMNAWTTRDGVERHDPIVTARSFELLDSKSSRSSSPSSYNASARGTPPPQPPPPAEPNAGPAQTPPPTGSHSSLQEDLDGLPF